MPSAGIRPPAERKTSSPGTTSAASIWHAFPSRSTFAAGEAMARSDSSVRSVLNSCTNPKSPFIKTITAIVTASTYSPMISETAVHTSSTSVITSLNWVKNKAAGCFFLPFFKRFGPYFCSRRNASSVLSPRRAIFSFLSSAAGAFTCPRSSFG